ncbi:MAG: glycosyltransferase [Myxococcaceae bacterium]
MDGPGVLEVGVLALVSDAEIARAGSFSIRDNLAARFLAGDGIELGALNNPLKVPPSAYVRYVDRLTLEQCRQEYPELGDAPLITPTFISDAEALRKFSAESEQFVIANHVFEHMRNPLGALAHWVRVLRPGACLYVAIPSRNNGFDRTRAVTTFGHLLEDNMAVEDQRAERDHEHYIDWARSVRSQMPTEEQQRFAAELERTGYRIHFHVFDLALFERVIAHVVPGGGADVVELVSTGDGAGDEHIAVIRKRRRSLQPRTSPGVDIVVPIYNAREFTRRCIESVLRHATGDWRLILVDDCSPDPLMAPMLREFAERDERVVVLTQPQNQGFVLTANRGMRYAGDRDVLLLNSDTEVFEGFLERLVAAAYEDPQTGILTPFSNNATLCSIPECGKDNPIPEGFTPARFAALVSTVSRRQRPEIPTGVGFCMFVKNVVLEEIGLFDEVSFGRGFGEENDLVERAKKAGFTNRLCDDVFVWHKGKASFAAEGHALESKNGAILEKKHPGYHAAVARFFENNPLTTLHDEIRFQLARLKGGSGSAPLFLLHASPLAENGGGTEFHVRDLLRALAFPRAVVAWCQGPNIRVAEILNGDISNPLWFKFPIERPVIRNDRERPDVDAQLLALIRAFGIQWVHVHHAIDWPLSLASTLKQSGLPVVYTSHDYYAVCPSWNMFDHARGASCACDPEIKEPGCLAALFERMGVPEPDPIGLRLTHRRAFTTLVEIAEGVIFPSESARQIVSRYLPLPARTVVIPHGLDIASPRQRAPRGDRLRVAVVGEVAHPIKGADGYLELVSRTESDPLEWHFFGTTKLTDFEARLTRARATDIHFHGRYRREDITGLLAERGIDLVVLLPAVNETFSFVLSEAWAAGVPVLALRRGSLEERISASGAGVTCADMDEIVAQLRKFIADPESLAPFAAKAATADRLSVAESTARLSTFYSELGLTERLSVPMTDPQVLRAAFEARVQADAPAADIAEPPPVERDPSLPSRESPGYLGRLKPYAPRGIWTAGRLLTESVNAMPPLIPGSRTGHVRSTSGLEVIRRGLVKTAFVASTDDPQIDFGIRPISTRRVAGLRFRLKHSLAQAPYAQLFWTHRQDEGYSERKSAKVRLVGLADQWCDYVLRLDAPETAAAWEEDRTVVGLRFDPLNVPGPFEVSWLQLILR